MFGVPQIQETPTMPLWGIGIRVTQVEGSYCPCWIQMGNPLQSSYEPIVGHAIRTSMNILKLYEMHFQSFLQKANTYFCRKWTVNWSIGKDHVCEAWLPRYPATRLWRFSLTSRGSCSHGLWTWRIYPQLWILHWNHEVLTYWICLGVPLKYSDKPNEIMSVIYAGQTQMTSVTLYIYKYVYIYIYVSHYPVYLHCIPIKSQYVNPLNMLTLNLPWNPIQIAIKSYENPINIYKIPIKSHLSPSWIRLWSIISP
jgi:hypothetical protein